MQNKRGSATLIFGGGVSGRAALQLLKQENIPLILFDDSSACFSSLCKEFPSLIFYSQVEKVPFERIDRLILSPGINPSHALCQRALSFSIEIISEVEYAVRKAQSLKLFAGKKVIGLTGTNGKSSAIHLLSHLYREHMDASHSTCHLGNEAEPLSCWVKRRGDEEILFIELSSFQLEYLFTPFLDWAIFLHFDVDHLNYHGSLHSYCRAKMRIASLLNPSGRFSIEKSILERYSHYWQEWGIRPNENWSLLPTEGQASSSLSPLQFHLIFLFSHLLKVSPSALLHGLASLSPLPHRLQLIHVDGGISYYDSSKATNLAALIFTLSKVSSPILLIAGGRGKGEKITLWKKIIPFHVKNLFLIGEMAPYIARELCNHLPLRICTDLAQAVQNCVQEAVAGDCVLFAPGCANTDYFLNYREAGKAFQREVLHHTGHALP